MSKEMIKVAENETELYRRYIVEVWRDHEREGESRTPNKYLKKTRLRGLLLIMRGG